MRERTRVKAERYRRSNGKTAAFGGGGFEVVGARPSPAAWADIKATAAAEGAALPGAKRDGFETVRSTSEDESVA